MMILRNILARVLTLLCLGLSSFPSHAESCDDDCIARLRSEIVTLNQYVMPLVEPLLLPGVDARTWVSRALFVKTFNILNEIPDSARKITFVSTGHTGNYAGDTTDCGFLGAHSDWRIQPRGQDALQMTTEINRISTNWDTSSGLSFTIPVYLTASARLHYHSTPCIGNGFGWDIDVVGFTPFIASIEGNLKVEPASNGNLHAYIIITRPHSIVVALLMSGVPIPFIAFNADTKGLIGSVSNTNLTSLWKKEGVVHIPQPDGTTRERHYFSNLGAVEKKIEHEGYTIIYNLDVTFNQ